MKKNKTIFFVIVIILFLIAFSACNHDRIAEVRILYTPIATYSAEPVHCDIFEFAFDKIIKERDVGDKDFLENLGSDIRTLTKAEDTLIIDVRIKCFVKYTNRVDTLCITNNGLILVNGSLMNRNEKLVNRIRNKIY